MLRVWQRGAPVQSAHGQQDGEHAVECQLHDDFFAVLVGLDDLFRRQHADPDETCVML
jgi:hypothetical protein